MAVKTTYTFGNTAVRAVQRNTAILMRSIHYHANPLFYAAGPAAESDAYCLPTGRRHVPVQAGGRGYDAHHA
ncbi:hypothetical protein KL86DES1_20395 [uncultured Desulfovibrio sp.]|uniref:Uncharacterized protein n=1 Tax=uncultured Desulfovibrio sp. TaxID=167968 RepID=A0A212L419_9BACT|nr:hypothetical protein KL86DES1_20395 [uncultured Desulfovibrio sp.]VZH33298.1 conserved protein of unknown function [Desulfovibrio sp. 86]